MEKMGPRDPRITKHILALGEASGDIEKFAAALRSVRDDPKLGSSHRTAIYKTLAQQVAQAYVVFASGKPIDLGELLEAAGDIPPSPKSAD